MCECWLIGVGGGLALVQVYQNFNHVFVLFLCLVGEDDVNTEETTIKTVTDFTRPSRPSINCQGIRPIGRGEDAYLFIACVYRSTCCNMSCIDI